jgi:uncharacterized protein (TIGR02996 family)
VLIETGQRRVLHVGDFFQAEGASYVFGDFDEARNRGMEEAIAAAPDDAGAKQVYADWLLERGDPLGERIIRPVSSDDARWLEGLNGVEVEWRQGLIDRATIRDPGARGALALKLTWLLGLRAASVLRELAVDLHGNGVSEAHALAESANGLIARLPAMPALRSLSFGYCIGEGSPPAVVVPQDDPRFPWLDPAPVLTWASGACFEVVEAGALDGARFGDRIPAAGMRLRCVATRVILGTLEELRREPRWASCSIVDGRVLLSNRYGQPITVNGEQARSTWLLPGDVIEAWTDSRETELAARLRFELER